MSGFSVPGHLHCGAAWCWRSASTGTAQFWLLLSHRTAVVIISGLRSNCDEPHKPHGSLPVTLLSWWHNPSVLDKTSISVCIFLMQKHAGQLSCINHCVSLGVKAKGFCTRTSGQLHLSLIPQEGWCSTLWTSSAQAGRCRDTPSSVAVSCGPGRAPGCCSGYFLQADFVFYPSGFVAGLLRSCPRNVPKHHRLRCQRTAAPHTSPVPLEAHWVVTAVLLCLKIHFFRSQKIALPLNWCWHVRITNNLEEVKSSFCRLNC